MWLGSAYRPLVRLRYVPSLLLRQHHWSAEGPSAGAAARPGAGGSSSATSPGREQAEITVDVGPGTTTVFIRGGLDLVTMPFLAEQLAAVLETMPGRLVLDLSRTRFVDCGSARLLAAAGRSLPPGQRLVIRRPVPGVRRIFELTGLDANCDMEA
ncbi:MAG: STAS domain-containing protein [Actinomycetota bacterium]|nr:STAS domain-containing protein [Actinomycetota bacterium]